MKTTLFEQKAFKKSNRGGKRPGAGRPSGTGKYGEPTRAVRVPERLVSDIKAWCKSLSSQNFLTGERYKAVKENKLTLDFISKARKTSVAYTENFEDEVSEKLDLNNYLFAEKGNTYYVRAHGDSMLGAGIHQNDLLVVDRKVEPECGNVIVAILNGEMTVKRYQVTKNGVTLCSENPTYPPIPVLDGMSFEIWGVVTAVVHKLI